MTIFTLIVAATIAASPQDAPPPAPPAAFASAEVLDVTALEKTTAREDVSLVAVADQAATVSGNSITGPSATGVVAIDGNAFQNISGLAIINTNTGNNVAINAAMNVNIHLVPGQ